MLRGCGGMGYGDTQRLLGRLIDWMIGPLTYCLIGDGHLSSSSDCLRGFYVGPKACTNNVSWQERTPKASCTLHTHIEQMTRVLFLHVTHLRLADLVVHPNDVICGDGGTYCWSLRVVDGFCVGGGLRGRHTPAPHRNKNAYVGSFTR